MADSRWLLSLDLLSGKMLVWLATWGRDAELTPDAHLYFFDRYSRLAHYHRRHGHAASAARMAAKAEAHRPEGFGDGPPYAAAMAMPRPRRFVRTNAVARPARHGPDDAA